MNVWAAISLSLSWVGFIVFLVASVASITGTLEEIRDVLKDIRKEMDEI